MSNKYRGCPVCKIPVKGVSCDVHKEYPPTQISLREKPVDEPEGNYLPTSENEYEIFLKVWEDKSMCSKCVHSYVCPVPKFAQDGHFAVVTNCNSFKEV